MADNKRVVNLTKDNRVSLTDILQTQVNLRKIHLTQFDVDQDDSDDDWSD